MTTPARTSVRPLSQIHNVDTYNDQLSSGAALETTTDSLEDNFHAVISQLNRFLNTNVAGNNWYSDINTTASGKKRGIVDLNTELAQLEEHKLLCRVQLVDGSSQPVDITVGAGNNYVVLGAGELPSEVAAIALTQSGCVGASSALSGVAFEAWENIVITGASTINPKNLVLVRDATTLEPIQSTTGGGNTRDVHALLQFESGLADGDTITTSTPNRAKLSFVRVNDAVTALEAVPVADIATEVINISYITRTDLESVPEDCFLANGTFTDLSGAVNITRQEAYDNQGATTVTTGSNATLQLGAGLAWTLEDAAAGDLFTLTEGSGGGTTTLVVGTDVDTYNNNAVDVNFDNPITVANAAAPINFGASANTIDSTTLVLDATAGAMTVQSDSGNMTLQTTTSGNMLFNSVGTILADASGNVEINSSGGTISVGNDAVNQNIDIGAAGTRTISMGSTAATLDLDAGSGGAAMTATGGDITLSTATSGGLSIETIEWVLIATATPATAPVSIEATKNHWQNGTTGNIFHDLNMEYTSNTATTGGLTAVYQASATAATTVAAGGFTAGVAAVSNPTVVVSDASNFAANDIILVSGANDPSNNGLYEIQSIAVNTITVRGVGTAATVEAFTDQQFVTDTTVTGNVNKVSVSILRVGSDGVWEVGTGDQSGITYGDVSSATVPKRSFFQDTLTNTVTPGNPITAADMTGASLPTKPSGGFTFDTDARIYLNGVLLWNGSGNDVSNGTGTNINIEAGGPRAFSGDVLTIEYWQDIGTTT